MHSGMFNLIPGFYALDVSSNSHHSHFRETMNMYEFKHHIPKMFPDTASCSLGHQLAPVVKSWSNVLKTSPTSQIYIQDYQEYIKYLSI